MAERRYGRRGRPAGERRFSPRTFTFDDESSDHVDQMAYEDGKEYSEWMRDLVGEEWIRRHPQAVSVACDKMGTEYAKNGLKEA